MTKVPPPRRRSDVIENIIKTFQYIYDKEISPQQSRRANDRSFQTHGKQFLKHWFLKLGTPYHFIFKKNASVTNIQFGELLSLIVKYRTDKFVGFGRLQFLSSQEFSTIISDIMGAYIQKMPPSDSSASEFNKIAEQYWDIISNIIVFEPLFGSCAVLLPPGLSVDIASICGASGYIHSCGRSVLIRNMNKATPSDLEESLKPYMQTPKTSDRLYRKILFVPYCHEDFTPFDRSNASELRSGLDDIKIHLTKYYMGGEPLVRVLQDIEKKFNKTIIFPGPGDFSKADISFRQSQNIDLDKTLFLIIDRGIAPGTFSPSGKRYYICYEQQFINGNIFHRFDENKPAWIAHTTIPHTLMGAMINISWMYAKKTSQFRVADPFVGSGTTYIELLKFKNVKFHGSDLSPFANLLTMDNIEICSLKTKGLERLAAQLKEIEDHLGASSASCSHQVDREYKQAEALARTVMEGNWEPILDRPAMDKLEKIPTLGRIVFYTFLKAGVRHAGEIKRLAPASKDINSIRTVLGDALRRELSQVIKEMHHLIDDRSMYERYPSKGLPKDNIVQGQGLYSRTCFVDFSHYQQLAAKRRRADQNETISCKDASLPWKKNAYDLIVADPPYGFNTVEDNEKLAKLYRKMIPNMLNALTDGGQIVLALPEISRTGKNIPFFSHKKMVIHQIVVEARALKMDVLVTGHAGGRPEVARPPYYWESERALRRSILHFRFRKS